MLLESVFKSILNLTGNTPVLCAVQKLETEYSELHPLLGEVISAANELMGSDLVDSEDEGEEEAGENAVFKERATAERRYEALQEELRELREEVDAATAKYVNLKMLHLLMYNCMIFPQLSVAPNTLYLNTIVLQYLSTIILERETRH